MEEEQVHLFSRRVLSLVRWDERGSDWYFWLRAAIYSGDNRGNQSRLCGYKFQKIHRGDGRLILHITKTKLEYRQSWLCQELLGKLLQRHFVWSNRLFWTNDSQPILYVGLKHLEFVNVICKQKHTFTNKKKTCEGILLDTENVEKTFFSPSFSLSGSSLCFCRSPFWPQEAEVHDSHCGLNRTKGIRVLPGVF